jgi:hypothetical protein
MFGGAIRVFKPIFVLTLFSFPVSIASADGHPSKPKPTPVQNFAHGSLGSNDFSGTRNRAFPTPAAHAFTTPAAPVTGVAAGPATPPIATPASLDRPRDPDSGEVHGGPETLASPDSLKSLFRTLRAEKQISVSFGSGSASEIWRMVFRQPQDCLLTVYTADMRKVRTIYYHGRHVKIDAGKVKQEFDDQRQDGWERALLFLGYYKGREISEYRQVSPGTWIPNQYGGAPAKQRPSVQHKIRHFSMNGDVDADFAGVK